MNSDGLSRVHKTVVPKQHNMGGTNVVLHLFVLLNIPHTIYIHVNNVFNVLLKLTSLLYDTSYLTLSHTCLCFFLLT